MFTVVCLLAILVASTFAKLIFWIGFFFFWLPRTSRIPGPFAARYSRLWLLKTLASGNSARVFVEVNKQYGHLARIGPNHVLIDDPNTVRRILARGSRYTKAPWFDALRLDPHSANVVAERNERTHDELRRKLAPAYPASGHFETVIDQHVKAWICRLQQLCRVDSLKPFDIGSRIQFLTMDIVSELTLGKSFGCTDSDADRYDLIAAIRAGMRTSLQMSAFPEILRVLYHLTRVPFLHRLFVPSVTHKGGIGRTLQVIEEAIERQSGVDAAAKINLLDILLAQELPRAQVREELIVSMAAGFATTATAIQGTLLAIISNAPVYIKLMKEIDQHVNTGRISSPIKNAEARDLPYLQACISEGLRIYPPVGQLRERRVPPEGDEILDYRVSGVYGNDVETFRPERWLTLDEVHLQAMRKAHELIFSHGPTKCLGVNIAMAEISKTIFEVFRYFDIAIMNPTKSWISVCWGVFFQENFKVLLSQRESRNNPEAFSSLAGLGSKTC